MSQTTAAARTARAPSRTTDAQPPRLRVVSGQQAAARQGGAGFVLLCTGLLVATMLALLLLNTSRAEASFKVDDLRGEWATLADTESSLRAQIDDQRSPAHLAKRATAQGMVPSDSAAFIRASDGTVLGVARKAEAQPDFRVVNGSTPEKEAGISDLSSAVDQASLAGAADLDPKHTAPPAGQESPSSSAKAPKVATDTPARDQQQAGDQGDTAKKSAKDTSTTTKR